MKIVARGSDRLFVQRACLYVCSQPLLYLTIAHGLGLELVDQDADFIDLDTQFAIEVIKSAAVINLFPSCLKSSAHLSYL
jgi:hypothetical protein